MPLSPQMPPPGIVRMATPEATPGRWYDCNNIRFRQGQVQPIGGNALMPGTSVADTPRDLITWHDNTYTRWAAFGTDHALYAFNFSTETLYTITPTGVGPLDPPGALVGWGLGTYGAATYGTARDPSDIGPQDIANTLGDQWSMDTFGQILLVVPTQDGHLYSWNPTTPTVLPAIVAGAPTMNRAVKVTDQRSAVLIGAGGDPRMIAWSDVEDYTAWTPSVTNLAGSKELVTQAYALNGLKLPQGLLIFTSNDCHLMQYVGPPFAYGIYQIGAGCGPISLRAAIAIGSFAAWPSLQAFWSYNGYTVSPMQCDVQDWFYSIINRNMAGRLFGSPNPAYAELWWDWPSEDALDNNRYIAVNYVDPQRPWTIGMRNRTCGDVAGTMDSPLLGGVPPAGGGGIFMHEYGWTDNGAPRAAAGLVYAESGAIVLGEGDRRYHCTQLVFDAATLPPDSPVIAYDFTVREQPGDAGSEFIAGPYTEVVNGLMDMRWSGRTARMRMMATDDLPWAVGKARLQIKQGGFR
jgi:hypothetical protein